jgi:Flp pilus assembly pilin Flp
MSDLITTTQDTFRDQCIGAYVGFESFVKGLVQRAREADGQTAAEYMGVLLVVSVIIAGVATTGIGQQIVGKMTHLVNQIASGNTDKPAATKP